MWWRRLSRREDDYKANVVVAFVFLSCCVCDGENETKSVGFASGQRAGTGGLRCDALRTLGVASLRSAASPRLCCCWPPKSGSAARAVRVSFCSCATGCTRGCSGVMRADGRVRVECWLVGWLFIASETRLQNPQCGESARASASERCVSNSIQRLKTLFISIFQIQYDKI